MGQTIDIDASGRKNEDGSALEYFDSAAIGEALRNFIMSAKGDYLYQPTTGGITDSSLFKVMTPEATEMLSFKIRNAITNNFDPYVSLRTIDITSDAENRLLQIDIIYYTEKQEVKNTTIYVAADFDYEIKTYIDIEYVGQNLYNFCVAKKTDMNVEILKLDTNDNIWKWGIYAFVNLTTEDEYFDEILLVCNNR
jgi:hypothetical protein